MEKLLSNVNSESNVYLGENAETVQFAIASSIVASATPHTDGGHCHHDAILVSLPSVVFSKRPGFSVINQP